MLCRRHLWCPFFLLLLIVIPRSDRPLKAQEASGCIVRHRDAVPLCECFPVSRLAEADQLESRKLLLKALDSEALYTLVGGDKPVSEGFYSTRFRIAPPDVSEIEKHRQLISVWTCGSSISSGIMTFEQLHDGERFAAGWLANEDALRQLRKTHSGYFEALGITESSTAESVMLSIERSSRPEERWRGFGLVFGYPDYAVEFFVRAGLHQRETGEFVERDFRQYPTIQRPTGGFVYAVPKVTREQSEEAELRERCRLVLEEYKGLRKEFCEGDRMEPELILRRLYDDGYGWCHPDHAKQKVRAMSARQSSDD